MSNRSSHGTAGHRSRTAGTAIRRAVLSAALLASATAACFCPQSARAQWEGSRRVLLMLRSPQELRAAGGFASASLAKVADRWSAVAIDPLFAAPHGLAKGGRELDRIVMVSFPNVLAARNAATEFAGDPLVEYAAQEILMRVDEAPDDSAWASQWGAQRVGTSEAWTMTKGDAKVVIGVIDTGIDFLHPDLNTQLWVNAAEDRNGNRAFEPWHFSEIRDGLSGELDGVDDDGNGTVDDVIGYDFTDQRGFGNAAGGDYMDPDPDVTDEMGHGTSVSGIIAAAAGNGIGIAGVAPGCRLMTLRAFDARGVGAEGDVARALIYAVENGASIVNMSFGDVQYSRVLRDVVRFAFGRGVVMVASAGNSQSSELHYPSAYDETISVSATAENDILAGFSNYGATIDIAAPGAGIITTERGGHYGAFSGTSASAPFVSGAAALLRSLRPGFSPEDVRGVLLASARDLGAPGWDDRYGAGLLDVARAASLDNPSMVKIIHPKTDFGVSGDTLVIVGTAATPTMSEYSLEYGMGANPQRWTPILPPRRSQAINDTLHLWHVAELPDTTYTIRLAARSAGGFSIEDRVVIHLDRTPPRFLGIGLVPAIDGATSGVAVGFIADEPVLGRVWFRIKGSGDAWSSASMEGGTVNNLFVGTTHQAFLGEGVLLPGRVYEMYFTAENQVGLQSVAMDGSRYFEASTGARVSEFGFMKKQYSLPSSRLFASTPDFNSNGRPELLLNDYSDEGRFKVLELHQNAFLSIGGASQGVQYPRGVGRLKSGERLHLLTSFVRQGFIHEAAQPAAAPSDLIWADTLSQFWPVTIADADGSGPDEVLAVLDDSTVGIFRLSEDNRLTRIAAIVNPTAPAYGSLRNSFNSPGAALGDLNGNGKTDLLFGDSDGDFFIFEHGGGNQFFPIWRSENDYTDASDLVCIGDFNGDGKKEFAVGFRTGEDDVIPFWYFGIFSLDASNRATELWSQRFYGVERSGQFGAFARIQNSLTAGNIDDDPAEELVITAFPELYAVDFDRSSSSFRTAFMLPLVNTNAVAIADFDGNGLPEFAVGTRDSVIFFERDLPASGPDPVTFIETAYLKANSIRISWHAAKAPSLYRLYKGRTKETLTLFGTFPSTSVTDFDIRIGESYIYAVSAWDTTKTPSESPLLFSRLCRPHEQARLDSAVYLQGGQVRLAVSQDVGPAIPAASSFLLNGARAPESVALINPRALLLSYASIADGIHGIRVTGLRDSEGIPFDEETFAVFEVLNHGDVPCHVEMVEFHPPDGFWVYFSRALDSATSSEPRNYEFQPGGFAAAASPDPADPRRVRVTPPGGMPIGALGREYILKVRNVRCASGGSVPDGAGSTAGLILNRENLDAMFVYPNPLRASDGQSFVTFANLTPRATIRIYSVAGEFIREITETDGNGGVEWRLDDEWGNRIPGGVYIFHAVGRDAEGNEIGRRTGKFAIAL